MGLSWAVLEASWAILAVLVACLGRFGSHLEHLGRLGERWGRVWASTEPREEGAVHATRRCPGGGGPFRRLQQEPYHTALGILARLNVPGGTVADSAARERKEFSPAEARTRFVILLRNILEAGATHVHIGCDVTKEDFWSKTFFRAGYDFTMWAYFKGRDSQLERIDWARADNAAFQKWRRLVQG